MKGIVYSVIAVVLAGWLALFLTTSGLLIHSQQHRKPGQDQDTLTCTYFIGTSIIVKDFWGPGFYGREVCPRILRLG